MLRKIVRSKILVCALASLAAAGGRAQEVIAQPLEVVISVPEQRMVVLRDGGVVAKYKISTSRFGLGDAFGSYKTPVGHFKICDKVGETFASGTVIKNRAATGEVLPVNALGRDPIVTRILWLDGLDEQNRNARARGIYIHGTTEENRLGEPVSWGCIRMRSCDVIALFDELPVGAPVSIVATKLPKLHKYVPVPLLIIASNAPAARPRIPESAPRLASNQRSDDHPRLSELAVGPAVTPGDPGAAQALKGSILSAGLTDPDPQKIGPQKQDRMTFHSWSTVSLRDAVVPR